MGKKGLENGPDDSVPHDSEEVRRPDCLVDSQILRDSRGLDHFHFHRISSKNQSRKTKYLTFMKTKSSELQNLNLNLNTESEY
jgi:hypothetical protein